MVKEMTTLIDKVLGYDNFHDKDVRDYIGVDESSPSESENIQWTSLSKEEEDVVKYLKDIFSGERLSKFEMKIVAFKVVTQCSWEDLSEWVSKQSGYDVEMSAHRLRKLCQYKIGNILYPEDQNERYTLFGRILDYQ